MRIIAFLGICIFLMSCGSNTSTESTSDAETETMTNKYESLGELVKMDPGLDKIISPEAEMEILSEGYDWTEGPLWVPEHQMLLFSDIPPNSIFKWTEEGGAELFLKPSGYTGTTPRGGEPGSNGLILDAEGNLVLCQHGDRQMARYTGSWDNPSPSYETIVGQYEGKRFNSPNDAIYASNGDLFFTDPPYGLEGNVDDPAKEIPFQGVYRFSADGELFLLTDSITRPNGIGLSPTEDKLYVASSDPNKAIWVVYDLNNGQISNGKIFHDATDLVGEQKGLPDGLAVHSNGTIFATGPGGVYIFSPDGKVLGKLMTGQATSNCTIDEEGKVLYITADMFLVRIKLAV